MQILLNGPRIRDFNAQKYSKLWRSQGHLRCDDISPLGRAAKSNKNKAATVNAGGDNNDEEVNVNLNIETDIDNNEDQSFWRQIGVSSNERNEQSSQAAADESSNFG